MGPDEEHIGVGGLVATVRESGRPSPSTSISTLGWVTLPISGRSAQGAMANPSSASAGRPAARTAADHQRRGEAHEHARHPATPTEPARPASSGAGAGAPPPT
ncbi:hypothetical protein PA7_29310 [Pseudonocardia asaccharolytica DSM 44247 = NBRC 16224]|uniref:Uncharacterized protein n=1 Tax=Pseudonocardia asaccharolytica DSM 44247 = NBRC 16224 TaxID=1123024 RepID=A0A511D665_9PSEU|nr:hypothetical protein PA7_29310 [Pseudonocardia asaccharolytica DSM 44247 = NBRC 16224]